jgi:hypothetical protein
MKRKSWLTLVLITVVLFSVFAIATGQEKKPAIIAFGSDSTERGTVRVGYWNREKNTGAGGFFIDYGKPAWKKDYEDPAKFDAATKGKVWRLGSEYWTVLDTNIPIKISGVRVAPGQWYLGLQRSQDGASWSLVFIDPSKVRNQRLDPSEINKAPVEFKAPMIIESGTQMVEKLTLILDVPKEDLKQSTLRISWGNLQLKAPVEAMIGN